MKVKLSIILLFTFLTAATAQDMKSISFIDSIGSKKSITYGDAIKFFVLYLDKTTQGFKKDVNLLQNAEIIPLEGFGYDENKAVNRGILARMVANYLKLGDSLFYKIFGTNRYAYRACVAAGVMGTDQSEWDVITGEGLIEIMSIVEEKEGK